MVRFDDRFNTVASIAEAFIERDTPPFRDNEGKVIIEAIHAAADTRAVADEKQAEASKPRPAEDGAHQPDLFTPPVPSEEPAAPVPVETPPPSPSPPSVKDEADDAKRVPQDFTLAPRRGHPKIDLDVYDRENGPAKKARPA